MLEADKWVVRLVVGAVLTIIGTLLLFATCGLALAVPLLASAWLYQSMWLDLLAVVGSLAVLVIWLTLLLPRILNRLSTVMPALEARMRGETTPTKQKRERATTARLSDTVPADDAATIPDVHRERDTKGS